MRATVDYRVEETFGTRRRFVDAQDLRTLTGEECGRAVALGQRQYPAMQEPSIVVSPDHITTPR